VNRLLGMDGEREVAVVLIPVGIRLEHVSRIEAAESCLPLPSAVPL
jgi:hypothetical protein